MNIIDDFAHQASLQEVVSHGIAPRALDNRGIGIVAEQDLDDGQLILSVPVKALRTEKTVAEGLRTALEGVSVQGLLAIDVMLDNSTHCAAWKASVPDSRNMAKVLPFWWDGELQALLPEAGTKLLDGQKQKSSRDWKIISKSFPSVSYDDFLYTWFIVGTRTFYYTPPEADEQVDSDECLALVPFADYFNHSNDGCNVTFTPTNYNFTTDARIRKGEEVFISYGNHTNDFLMVEYGFCLEDNKWDEVSLDPVLRPLFNSEQEKVLQSENLWAGFVLDSHSVCYRTEAAARLLCMPLDTWRHCLLTGFDEEDEFYHAVNRILLECFKKISERASKNIQSVSNLPSAHAFQKLALAERWEQINQLVQKAIKRRENVK